MKLLVNMPVINPLASILFITTKLQSIYIQTNYISNRFLLLLFFIYNYDHFTKILIILFILMVIYNSIIGEKGKIK